MLLLTIPLSAEKPEWVQELEKTHETGQGRYIVVPGKTSVRKIVHYRGNESSKVLHKPGCFWYECKNCTRVFLSRDQAWVEGYRPCWFCKPEKD